MPNEKKQTDHTSQLVFFFLCVCVCVCLYIYIYILSETSLATPDCSALYYLVNVETMEYCSICLETAFITEEFCVNVLVVLEVNFVITC